MANIEFEHIDPWVDGQGDTGYSSRLKIRRNFEKIKAWIDSVTQQLSGKYLSKETDDEAAGKISFRAGSEWGPATGLWGWVKESYTRTVGAVTQTLKDGVAWFRNLLADYIGASAIEAGSVKGTTVSAQMLNATLATILQRLTSSEVVTELLRSENFREGFLDGQGFGMWIDGDGKSHFEADIIATRMKMMVAAMEIRELSYVGGNYAFTGAGARIEQVVALSADGEPIGGEPPVVPPGQSLFTRYSNDGGQTFTPAAYKALEYIEKTANAGYLDTGYVPNNRTKIVAKVMFPSGHTATSTLWCSRTNINYTQAQPSFSMWWMVSNQTRMDWRDHRYNGALIKLDEIVTVTAEGGFLTYPKANGEEVTIGAANTDEWQMAYPITLWATKNGTATTLTNHGRGRIYRFAIYEGDTLIQDWIPAQRTSDGKIGLYDLVGGNFIFHNSLQTGGSEVEACDLPEHPAFQDGFAVGDYVGYAVGTSAPASPSGFDWRLREGEVAMFRCYWPSEKDGLTVHNVWQLGDQAKCQTFNLDKKKNEQGIYEDVENRYYWRLVVGKGEGVTLSDGNKYNYVDLAEAPTWGYTEENGWRPIAAERDDTNAGYELVDGTSGDAPAAGDSIVAFGNRRNTSRMGIIEVDVEDAHGTGKAPAFNIYAGVNTFTLTNKLVIRWSPIESVASSRHFKIFSGNDVGKAEPLTVNRGAYSAIERYFYGDMVSYDGQAWVCVFDGNDGRGFIGETPSEDSEYWQLYIAKGQDGAKGDSGTSRWMVIEPSNVRVYRDDDYDLRTSEDISGEIQVTLYEQTNGVTTKVRDDAHFSVNGKVNVKNGQPEYPNTIFINTKTYPSSDGVLRWDETNSRYYLDGGLTEDIKFSSLIFLWESSVGSAFARYEMPLSVDGDKGDDGLPGTPGQDGADGKDGAAFMLSPSEFVITEKCNDNAGWSGNWDVANNAVVAVASCKVGTTSPEVTITAVKLEGTNTDSTILSRQNSTTGKANLKINTNALNNDSSIRSHSVDVTLSATVNGVATTHTLRFRLYVNRLGTLKSETIGDATKTIREKTGWEVNPETGEWKELAYKSDVVDAADRFSREISSLKISKNLLLNADFDEETESGRGAIHLVPTRRWQGYQQESRNAQGDWVARLTRNKKYTLSIYARGSGYGGALVHLVNVSTGDVVGDQPFINIQNLTSHWKRYSVTFTVPSTANRGFRVQLGSMGSSSAAVTGADIEIARPQLEEGEKATIYTATGSRNLLANSTFGNISKNKPEGWTYWENEESGGIVEPTTREIIAEKVLALWGEWNGTGGTVAPKVQEIRVDAVNGWKYLHVEPADMFQGIMQDSSVRSGGEWKGVLQHGGWYVLSFYARGLGRSDGFLHLVKRNGQHISQPQPALIVEIVDSCHADAWNRYQTQPFQAIPSDSADYDVEHGYGFSLMLGCAHYSEDPDYHVPSEVIEIARPQLEEGKSASDWRRGEENPELVATRFEQTAQKMELAVYRDGVKRSGMKIDEDGVELDGKTTKINGDLDLQGLTTENVTPVARNPRYPTVINMGIVENGEDVVKSVQVYGDADSASTDIGNHIVVLPFYDEVNSKWTEKYSGITLNGDDTFNLYGDKKVVQWKKSGTKLSVTNSVIFRYRNWQENTDPNYANMLAGMVVVCSDGRVISKGNIESERPYNPSTDADGSLMQPQLHAGLFSCGGYIARFIVLLPGQTLQLRSQIVMSNYRKVLVWVVENPTEFVPFFSSSKASKIEFVTYPDGSISGTLDYISNIASFNPTVHYHGSAETIMVPAAMNYRSDRVLVFSELYP
ncbi:MAG: hypothetical protein IKN21_06720 [Prevotella sp.]|nr:hypothetical protein [Prevotella sp.]